MPDDQYECNMCGATFDSQEELEEHNRKEHPEQSQEM